MKKAVVAISDISWRKQAETALAKEKKRLAVTLRSIGDGVICTDTAGSVVLMNRAAEELTGWTEKEAADKPLSKVFYIINENTRKECKNPVRNEDELTSPTMHHSFRPSLPDLKVEKF